MMKLSSIERKRWADIDKTFEKYTECDVLEDDLEDDTPMTKEEKAKYRVWYTDLGLKGKQKSK